jgi:hypothetical protein
MSGGERFVLTCLQEGWWAFRRGAWALLSLALLLAGLLALPPLAGGVLAPLGRLATALLLLWGTSGLLRGAATALAGRRPGPRLLLRRDVRGCRRLLLAALLVLALVAVAAMPGTALVALSGRFAPSSDPLTALLVALLPLLPGLVVLALLPLGPLLTMEGKPVLATAWRSLLLVRERPGAALVLAAVQLAALGLSGGLHPLLGVVVGLPLAICLGAATAGRLSRSAGC